MDEMMPVQKSAVEDSREGSIPSVHAAEQSLAVLVEPVASFAAPESTSVDGPESACGDAPGLASGDAPGSPSFDAPGSASLDAPGLAQASHMEGLEMASSGAAACSELSMAGEHMEDLLTKHHWNTADHSVPPVGSTDAQTAAVLQSSGHHSLEPAPPPPATEVCPQDDEEVPPREVPGPAVEEPDSPLQQPEGLVTDRAALCYTGQPRLLTSVTAPFSAKNFTKGCKWSPDGTCLLVCSEDARLRLLNLPEPLYRAAAADAAPAQTPPPQVALQSAEGELIYDYCWFPLMRSDHPATCCYASTSRAHPVHLFDAFDGGLRCSYRAYNSVDEVSAAYSLAFDPAGDRLFAGMDGWISVFDVSRPGRQLQTRKMKDKQSLTSQPGIISCISLCPASPEVYAAGSYLRSIGVYGTADGAPLCLLQGQAGGVTHLQFSPDGRRLYSGGRRDPEILCWDLRNLGRILFSLQREVTTNQRVYFDTDWSGRHLFSGDCAGSVQVWDTLADPCDDLSDTLLLPSVRKFTAHSDCCNGVSVHPWLPVLATSSGQRHCPGLLDSSDEEDSDSDSPPPRRRAEGAVKLWWLGH